MEGWGREELSCCVRVCAAMKLAEGFQLKGVGRPATATWTVAGKWTGYLKSMFGNHREMIGT